jgi:hypothetical protein
MVFGDGKCGDSLHELIFNVRLEVVCAFVGWMLRGSYFECRKGVDGL